MNNSTKSFTSEKRNCGSCTKCCEGRLEATIHGHSMYTGNPCRFLCKSKGCTIYKDRPENPCKSYTCAWLDDDTFPLWMQPHLINAIINKKVSDNITYYEIIEVGQVLQSNVLNWMFMWALRTRNNISYEISGKTHHLGDAEFVKFMDEQEKTRRQLK